MKKEPSACHSKCDCAHTPLLADTRRISGFLYLLSLVPLPNCYTWWCLCLQHSQTPSHWLSEISSHQEHFTGLDIGTWAIVT
ncbi:hypothetical protein PAL_GLEAN10023163 [Pteropus alecto]|uniref:Uncharacterized protein n=1 Tax=Pteropus alecto TaxID=9402 RepID=L5K4K3_PTEAL|nr:hypothetical protein PAL_GLEAN10023163 [Pteropus alecto]